MINRDKMNNKKYVIDLIIIFAVTAAVLVGFLIAMHFMGSSGGSSVTRGDASSFIFYSGMRSSKGGISILKAYRK